MKRVLSLFLSCIFVLGVCFSTPIVASAAEGDIIPSGEYTYTILSEEAKTCALSEYTGGGNSISVLKTVKTVDETDYTVIEIADGVFANATTVISFSVDSDNQYFSVADGVLFNKTGTKLIAYPAAKDGEEYTIPADVTEIALGAFKGAVNLEYVFGNNSVSIPEGKNVTDYFSSETVFHSQGKHEYINSACKVCNLDCGHIWETGVCTECGLVCEHTGLTCGEEGKCEICGETYTASHEWTFTKLDDENVIRANCDNVNCNYNSEQITITLMAPTEGLVYDEDPKVATIVVKCGEETLENALFDFEITYVCGETPVGSCINAGDYTALITLGEETVSVEYIIAPKPIEVDLVYDGEESSEFVYNGRPYYLTLYSPDVIGNFDEGIDYNIVYINNINVGAITATVKLKEGGNYTFLDGSYTATVESDVAIEKATPTVTAPTAITGLVYNGGEQELVNAGTTDLGILEYSLDNETWSGDIPEGLEAGEYTVYYRVENTDNYNGVDGNVNVTIEPKTIDVTLDIESYKYDGSHHTLTFKFTNADDEKDVTLNGGYEVKTYKNGTHVNSLIDVGEYKVVVTLAENSNYTFINAEGQQVREKELTYTITAGVATIKTAPTAKTGLVYTGSAKELVTAGEATNGTMQYRLSENESWSPAIPTAINAGTYKVYYKVAGDKNHSDSDVASVDVAIAKATPTTENFTLALPTNLVFNGEQKTVTVTCGADIGDVTVEYYSGETKLESAPVTVGTYSVKINVAENDNFNAVSGITSDDWNFTITECTNHLWENGECTVCEIDCEHKYEDGKSAISNKVITQATCVKEGVLLTQCKICDYEEETPLDIVSDAHKMSDWTETVKATCSSAGTEERGCENEGCTHTETRSTVKNPDNHTYGGWVVTEATCVADGVKVKTCTNTECKHELKETIEKDPTAHKMATEWKVTKAPTCVETGLQVKVCLNTDCKFEIEEIIPVKEDAHNLGGWVVTKEAKCTVAGEITRFCKNETCEYKVTDSLDADGKTHSFAKEFTIDEATCIAEGSKYRVCENEGCNEKTDVTSIEINPGAHKNVVNKDAKEPTCEEKGYTGDEFCSDCEKVIEPGIDVNALGHTESDWIIDKEATFTEEGAKHTACTVCKKELKKEVIAKRALETPEVKIENVSNGIKVSWSQDEDATGYTVYSSTYNAKTKKWSAWKNRGTAAATKSSWTDKAVTEGVTYRYTVRSVNGENRSAYKATSGILYVVAPKVTVSITSTGLLAKWDKVNNANSYIVYRAELNADGKWSSWTKLGTTASAKNTWSDTKVQSGVTYKYTVRAVVGKVKSGYTASSSVIYLAQPILKIENAANGITGKWASIAGATGYTIYRSEYNTSTKKWSSWLNLGTTKATAKSFTDKTAKSGVTYKYTIRAINGKLKSTYQDSNKLVYLAQPTLTISNVANGIQGKWNQVNGATGYIIYRSELKDGKWTSWTNLGTTKATTKSFTDKTAKSGVTYKYTIRAKNGNYKSSYVASNQSVFLSVPTVKITNAEKGVKVTWNKIEGATNYIIYRAEYNTSTKKWTSWKSLKTIDTTSFVDESVVSNVKYKYTVRALSGESRGYYKSSAELLYLATPTVVAEKNDGVIKVSWTKTEGATSYVIYRSELSADGKWSKWARLGTASEKYTSCKDKTVKEDATYKYTVRAVNGNAMSSYVASEQILNGVVESTPEEPKTDVVA